jgi:uncharacterized protein
LYDQGHGIPQDYAQAAQWYRKAAEQGLENAQCKLGFAYGKGHGVPQDYAEEYFWLDIGLSGQLPEPADAERVRNAAASLLTPAKLSAFRSGLGSGLKVTRPSRNSSMRS